MYFFRQAALVTDRAARHAARKLPQPVGSTARICCAAECHSTFSPVGIETSTAWHIYASKIQHHQGPATTQNARDLKKAQNQLQKYLIQKPEQTAQLQPILQQIDAQLLDMDHRLAARLLEPDDNFNPGKSPGS